MERYHLVEVENQSQPQGLAHDSSTTNQSEDTS